MNNVGKHMSTQLFTISPDEYAHKAIDKMYQNNISALLVKNDSGYVGIITKTDWMVLVLKGECDPKVIKVASIMTDIRHTIDQNEPVSKACAMIDEHKVRHIPVTRNGDIVGMFSVKDLEKYYLQLHKKTDF